MITNFIKKFFLESRNVFFLNIFAMLCQIFATSVMYIFFKKKKIARLFLPYTFSALLLLILNQIVVAYYNTSTHIVEPANILFSLIEYVTFYLYFNEILLSKIVRKIMTVFLVMYTILSFGSCTYIVSSSPSKHTTMKISDFLITPELVFLAGLCSVYYRELFKQKLISPQANASIWIVTALFIYSIIIAPFFIISDELLSRYSLYLAAYMMHYMSFGCLFLAIAKALLVKND